MLEGKRRTHSGGDTVLNQVDSKGETEGSRSRLTGHELVNGRGEGGPVVEVIGVTVELVVGRDQGQGEQEEADELDSE